MFRSLVAYAVVINTALMFSTSVAAPIPANTKPIQVDVRDMPIGKLLADLLAEQGLAANVSPKAAGTVTGKLEGTLPKVVDDLTRQFGLVWYFDGLGAVHITHVAESQSQVLWMTEEDMRYLRFFMDELKVSDERFTFKTSPTEGYVLVSGPPRYVERVLDLRQTILNSPEKRERGQKTRFFQLRYASAADTQEGPGVASVLMQLIGNPGQASAHPGVNSPVTSRSVRLKGYLAESNGSGGGQAAGAYSNRETVGDRLRSSDVSQEVGSSRGRGLSPNQSLESETSGGRSGTRAGTNSADAVSDEKASQEHRQGRLAPQGSNSNANTIGQPIIISDTKLNAVIIKDDERRMALYEQLIAQLDVEPKMVEIEATIIDANSSRLDELGIDWRLKSNRLDALASSLGNSETLTSPPTSNGSGLVITTLIGGNAVNLISRVQALADRGEARILSRPRVLTINNQTATLANTNEFYVRVAGERQADLFTVTYGLDMRVTPTIVGPSDEQAVKLAVSISDGNSSGQTVDSIPSVTRIALNTNGVIKQGESLLIGGYVVDTNDKARDNIPILGDLPGIGWLFGKNRESSRRVERFFIVTPRIVAVTSGVDGNPVSNAAFLLKSTPLLGKFNQ